jgi:hypothetical protein
MRSLKPFLYSLYTTPSCQGRAYFFGEAFKKIFLFSLTTFERPDQPQLSRLFEQKISLKPSDIKNI